jgi:hypothetical protein
MRAKGLNHSLERALRHLFAARRAIAAAEIEAAGYCADPMKI